MSGLGHELGQQRPGRGAWLCRHQGSPGTFDESARRASHDELGVARALESEGHHVRTVAEGRGGRSPDLDACGVPVEVKAFLSLSDRGGRPPTARGVANKLLDARGQGAVVVIWGGDSGLTQATARAGYRRFCDVAVNEGLGLAREARVVGRDFDLTFSPVTDLRRRPPGPPKPGALGA